MFPQQQQEVSMSGFAPWMTSMTPGLPLAPIMEEQPAPPGHNLVDGNLWGINLHPIQLSQYGPFANFLHHNRHMQHPEWWPKTNVQELDTTPTVANASPTNATWSN